MTDKNEKVGGNEKNVPSENNIFRITDELVYQVDKSKKMIIVMIISLIVALPVLWHVAPLVSTSFFEIAGYGTIILAIVFLALGVRQWRILSKWTSRYKVYKEMQKRVDAELDFEKDT
jgi:protein-S-isoprenylcysteine O-methyltransferase Ste14